jgi:hypothetical protein
VNPSATFLSKHTIALFLALRFTPFLFNAPYQFTPLFLRPLIFGLPILRWFVYILKSFFLREYHFLFTPPFSETKHNSRAPGSTDSVSAVYRGQKKMFMKIKEINGLLVSKRAPIENGP